MIMRKKKLLLIFLPLLCMLLAHPAFTQESPAAKKVKAPEPTTAGGALIEIPEATHDFGEVIEGESVSHRFVVKNKGTAELKIAQVRPG